MPEFKIEDNNREVILSLKNDSDGKTFEAVYKYFYGGLCVYSGRYVTRQDAEEIVQATMMWLWENKKTLIPELSLKSLLFTIVKNKSLDKVAKEKRTRRVRDILIARSAEKFDDPDLYLTGELFRKYEEAVVKLPENYKKYFEMSRIDGKTHRQIADEMEVSIQTVNYNIGQALKVLKRELKEYLPVVLLLLGVGKRML